MKKLNDSSVAVFGLGGVGGAAFEALVRSGIGTVAVVDKDEFDVTNLNRQLLSKRDNIGFSKCDEAEKRAAELNENVTVKKYDMFYLPETADGIDLSEYDFIVDAIDNVTAKLELIKRAVSLGVPIISSMGTGNKIHPELLEIADISKTSVCPLARVMRRELKKCGITSLDVVYSKEEPISDGKRLPASSSFVPPAAGFIAASFVVRKLLDLD